MHNPKLERGRTAPLQPTRCPHCGQPITRMQNTAYRVSLSAGKGLYAWAVKTGEYRNPRKGELYLSGAIPEVYLALNNLGSPFHIMQLVKE